MGSEGYLINEFTAPRTNDRTDAWGGGLENRLRFPVEIVRRMRAAVGPDFLVIYRMSSIDLVEGGIDRRGDRRAGSQPSGGRRRHAQHRASAGTRRAVPTIAQRCRARLGLRGRGV